MKASDIIFDVSSLLNDVDNITYSISDIISSINDAQRLISSARPDSTAKTVIMQLQQNTRQSLPVGYRLLLSVVRNVGDALGSTIGQAVGEIVDMNDMDLFNPGWHNDTGTAVESYMYNDQQPESFFVYPKPANANQYLEIVASAYPVVVRLPNDDLTVNDVYAPAIVSWCCYRMLSKDSSSEPNLARAAEHKNTVFTLIGMKSSSDNNVMKKINTE